MNNKIHVFGRGRSRVLLPVIHGRDFTQICRQADVAEANGADGVFVINQGGADERVCLAAAQEVAVDHPQLFVGVNLLGVSVERVVAVLAVKRRIRMMWSDNMDPAGEMFGALSPHLYFGGCAFKGQLPVHPSRYGDEARRAVEMGVNVVTTSGPRTGSPPAVEKVQAMRAAIGQHALALASGVSIDNVDAFLPYVDAFLVGTSLEQTFGELDPARVRALADKIHAYV